MTRRVLGGALALALGTLGCQATITSLPMSEEQAREARYGLLSLAGVSVAASSVEDSWHPASNVLDGNSQSAWAPVFSDPTPTLAFDLGGVKTLEGFAVKLSPGGTTVAVEVWTGTGWELIASGLAPAEAVLQTFDLPDRTTSQVRLTFGNVPASELFVCEVVLNGLETPPSPTPTPAVSPTPTPSVSPTPTPSPTPAGCECKVTGGGFVYLPGYAADDDRKATFGLVAMADPRKGAKGNITVLDHRTKRRYGGSVTRIACEGATVTFSGVLRRDGAPFTATVTDNGEPGTNDLFAFSTRGFSASGTLGAGGPGGGNIQVHAPRCD